MLFCILQRMETIEKKSNHRVGWKRIVIAVILVLNIAAVVLFSGCSKTGIFVQYPTSEKAQGECVVLIHGMARTHHSMDAMQEYLTDAGYYTVSLGYPSTKKTIEDIAAEYFQPVVEQCQEFQPSAIHFVTHSLGGIVLRTVLKEKRPENMGRVVMLSPPSKGSVAADKLKGWWFYKWLNGPAGQQLTTDEGSYPNQLGPVDYPVGIVTGDRYFFFDFWLSAMIPGRDDGKVSVTNARLEGMDDFLVVHETHPFIMDAEYVHEETLYFLQNGKFRYPRKSVVAGSGLHWFSFPSD